MTGRNVVAYVLVSRSDDSDRMEFGLRPGTDADKVFEGLIRKIDFERYFIETVYDSTEVTA